MTDRKRAGETDRKREGRNERQEDYERGRVHLTILPYSTKEVLVLQGQKTLSEKEI